MRRNTRALRIKAVTSRDRGDVELHRITAEHCPATNCTSEIPLSLPISLELSSPKWTLIWELPLARHLRGTYERNYVCPYR